MYQFYVIEIKKSKSGEYEHNVHWAFDADEWKARLKGEAKYFEVLSAAAAAFADSGLALHSVTLLSADGTFEAGKSYTAEQE